MIKNSTLNINSAHPNPNTLLAPTTLYEEAERRLQEIRQHQQEIEKELKKAPPGYIHIVKSGKRTQFYLRNDRPDRGDKYIRKSDTKTIGTFIRKAYYGKISKILNNESRNLDYLLKKSNNITEKIRCLYSDLPSEAKEYVDPIEMSDEDFIEEWLSIPYEGKVIPDHTPVFQTNHGEKVRSKSELTIANILAEKGIPYKYECPLTLPNGAVIYPDFTVLNVRIRKVFYWEHRGMMDDREYARQAVYKMKSMLKNGIIPGKNLIITEETSANPLGTDEIDSIIAGYDLI